jgi:predicted GNAT family N-acyltransferase
LRHLNYTCLFTYGRELQSPQLGRFYKRNGYKGKIQPTDICVWLEHNNEIIAAARLTELDLENRHLLQLRGVWVHKEQRGKNLGSSLLREIAHLPSLDDKEIYCLAFPHLSHFYTLNNYKHTNEEEAPHQLISKKMAYTKKGVNTIAMKHINHSITP